MNIDFLKHNKPVILISDKFRSVRFALRNLKNTIDDYEEDDKKAIPLIGTVSALANVSDSALSNVEHTLHNNLSSDAKKHFGKAAACSLFSYANGGRFNAQSPAVQQASSNHEKVSLQFSGDQYFASKRVALALGIDNVLMHQNRFIDVWSELESTLQNSLNKHNELSEEAVYYVCTEFFRILCDQSIIIFPNKFTYEDDEADYNTNLMVASTVALVASIATYCDLRHKKFDSDAVYNNSISLMRYKRNEITGFLTDPGSGNRFEEFLAEWTPRLS